MIKVLQLWLYLNVHIMKAIIFMIEHATENPCEIYSKLISIKHDNNVVNLIHGYFTFFLLYLGAHTRDYAK